MVKNILFTLFFIVVMVGCNDDDEIRIPRTYVPDDTFELRLIDLGFDFVLDNYVSTEDLQYMIGLDVSNLGIKDLTGIQDCKNINTLICDGNQLTSLDVSKNTKLSTLRCQNNKLKSLDVSKNSSLMFLECSQNQLTSLDVNKNGILEILYVAGNQIKRLDLSKNEILESLNVSANQLSELNVNDLSALENLNCSNNQLSILKANNGKVLRLNANDNPDLFCIEIYQGIAPTLLWGQDAHDSQFTWSEDCDY